MPARLTPCRGAVKPRHGQRPHYRRCGAFAERGRARLPARRRPVGFHPLQAQYRDAGPTPRAGRQHCATRSAATPRSWSIRRAGGCSGSARRTGRTIRRARPTARSTNATARRVCAAARLGARLIAHDLRALGIDVDCLPLADVPVSERRPRDRRPRLWHDPRTGRGDRRAVAEGLLEGGVLPVLKHIPGHGRATADSHHKLARRGDRSRDA